MKYKDDLGREFECEGVYDSDLYELLETIAVHSQIADFEFLFSTLINKHKKELSAREEG